MNDEPKLAFPPLTATAGDPMPERPRWHYTLSLLEDAGEPQKDEP